MYSAPGSLSNTSIENEKSSAAISKVSETKYGVPVSVKVIFTDLLPSVTLAGSVSSSKTIGAQPAGESSDQCNGCAFNETLIRANTNKTNVKIPDFISWGFNE